VIGSNIANIALVLGVTTLIFSINISDKTLKIDFPFLLFSTFLVGVVLFFFESVSFYSGFVFLLILSVFLYYIVKKSRNEINQEDNNQELLKTSMVLNFGYVVVAIVMLKFGADFLVDGAIEIANYFNVEERIIALTVVAIGTSVPELATSIVAALKKEVDLAVGNIVGSNIFNLLVVLGITALFKNINLENINILNVDYLFMLILTLIFGIMIYTFGRGRLNKLKGGMLLLIYAGYLIYTIY
jgi:cation:H+ antiporter